MSTTIDTPTWHQMNFDLDEYVVFDLETTGLSPWAGDEIIEIGAVKILDSTIQENLVFHSLVRPGRLIPESATRINGITNEMVEEAPSLDEVFPKFMEFIEGSFLVAQNAKFDMSFITKYIVEKKLNYSFEVFDTIHFSKRLFPDVSSHNLDVICERLNITYNKKDRHRSLTDVILTGQAFLLMKEKLQENTPRSETFKI